jgi:hypothetical protein
MIRKMHLSSAWLNALGFKVALPFFMFGNRRAVEY